MRIKLYSILDVAKLVGVHDHKIAYHHRIGRLGEASYVVAGKRIYDDEDLRRVTEYFKQFKKAKGEK